MIELLIYALLPFAAFPALALLPPAIFGWLAFDRFRKDRPWFFLSLATIAWIVYASWEISFKLVPAREWIRLDLILISPILMIVTVLAVISAIRNRAP